MKSKKLNFNEIKVLIIILILLSGFFIMSGVSWVKDGDIVITEVMYDPAGVDNRSNEKSSYEWVKLKNISKKSVNMSDWKIRLDKYYLPFGRIKDFKSEEEFIVYLGEGLSRSKNINIFLNKNGSVLGDDFGEVALYNKDKHNKDIIVDYVFYKKDSKNKEPSTSYKHAVDELIWKEGCFLGDVKEGDSLVVESNKCKIIDTNKDNDNEVADDKKDGYKKTIRINEILPSPKGSDDEGEYIELYNFGKEAVDLNEGDGWILEDRIGKKENNNYKKLYFNKYLGEKTIKSGGFLIVKGEKGFNFSLIGEDEVRLINSKGVEVDKIEYSGAREGLSYGYCEKTNKWHWSEFLTPGGANEFREVGEIEIDIDDDIYKDVYANFEVTVGGIKEDELKVKWEFGDGKNSYKNKVRHKYLKNGKYLVKLTVFNGSEDVKREFNIEVSDFPERKVSILAINPNPKGKDVDGEWIELKNKSKKKVNLKNWSVATGSNKKKLTNHPINDDFIIKAGKIKQLTREFSKFSLNNKKGYVELRYPDGEVAYDLKYKKEDGIDEDEIYKKKEGGGWEWVKSTINKIIKDTEEDAVSEIKDTNESVIEEINDVDLIRDMTTEDIGKYSFRERRNVLNEQINKELNIQIERELISLLEKQVLGVWDNKNKKIREEAGFYYFNPQTKEDKHYLLRFWENISM